MDVINTTANFARGEFRPRDHGAHRRAYLDTYARRRAGVKNESSSQQLQPALKTIPQPAVVAVPLEPAKAQTPVDDFIQQQPAVDGFTYRPAISQPATEDTATQKNYLDTLSRRYQAAVSQAPAAEETILSSTLSQETESLFDDPIAEKRLEANLNALYSSSLTDMISKNTTSASAAHVRTIVVSAFACGVIAAGIFSFLAKYDSQPVVAQPIGAPVIEVESSNTQKPTGAPAVSPATEQVVADPSHPVRMIISSIGVNAPVEGLGTTPEGLIAVPKAYGLVGWYNKSSIPGKPGPTVLVGHYAGGNGAVFDKLANLNDGDLITTTDGRGKSLTYRVIAKNEYQKDNVPMAQIFKSSKESRLEIITCAGKWQSKTYSNRLVVTAELVK